MLARCVQTALTHVDGGSALETVVRRQSLGIRRESSNESSALCALEALDGMLRRADDDGATAAVWRRLMAAARSASRKKDDRLWNRVGALAQWLLGRPEGNPLAGILANGDPDDDEDRRLWTRLAAAETLRRACAVKGDGVPAALAAVGAVGALDALIPLISGTEATRVATAAAKAVHAVVYALALGAALEGDEEEGDSDDDDATRSKRIRPKVAGLCRNAVWGSKLAFVVALNAARTWHRSSRHRGPYVLAIDDLRIEVGADAMNSNTGEYDNAGASAAQARKTSTVAKAWTGRDELLKIADTADRDGDLVTAAQCRAQAQQALDSGLNRLIWLIRTTPPSELHREWDDNKDGAATTALETITAELGAVLTDPRLNPDSSSETSRQFVADESDDSDDDDQAKGRDELRRIVEKRSIAADVKRLTARRLCLMIGQLKTKRLDEILAKKPDLQRSLHESTTALLKVAKGRESKRKSSSTAAIDAAHTAAASLAASALRRILESVLALEDGRAAGFASPLLALLDGDDGDGASAAVGELVAPVAVRKDGVGVLRDVLGRVDTGSLSALGVLEAILALAKASPPDTRRRVRKETSEFLVALLRRGSLPAVFLERCADLGRFLDVDVVVLAVKALAKFQGDSRVYLEALLGAAVTEGPNAALLVETLGAALRDVLPDDSPAAEEDELTLAPFVLRVLERAPAWITKIATAGGDRWATCARSVAQRVATAAKDPITLRLWGGVVDALDSVVLVGALGAILRALDRLPKPNDTLLFERLAPFLALKRIPAMLFTDLDTKTDLVLDDDDLDDEAERTTGTAVVDRLAGVCRLHAYDGNEHKTVATLAAECLGRLPSRIAVDAGQALDAFLKSPSKPLADRARVAVYALCHAASVHGSRTSFGAVFRTLATPGTDDLLAEVQRGCAHALAMLAGADAVNKASQTPVVVVKEEEEEEEEPSQRQRPLIVEVTDDDLEKKKTKPKGPLLDVAGLLTQVGGLKTQRDELRRRFAAVLDDDADETTEVVMKALADEDAGLSDDYGALRVGGGNAVATAVLQLQEGPPLRLLTDTVGAPALHAAGAVLTTTQKRHRTHLVAASAWLHVVFLSLVRLKAFPRYVAAVDVLGVALTAARHASTSNLPHDVDLRRNGLKILTALLGAVPNAFRDLPPASIPQAANALRGIAELEPNSDLRQLATKVINELDQSVASSAE